MFFIGVRNNISKSLEFDTSKQTILMRGARTNTVRQVLMRVIRACLIVFTFTFTLFLWHDTLFVLHQDTLN